MDFPQVFYGFSIDLWTFYTNVVGTTANDRRSRALGGGGSLVPTSREAADGHAAAGHQRSQRLFDDTGIWKNECWLFGYVRVIF